jgi:hypothetical protein
MIRNAVTTPGQMLADQQYGFYHNYFRDSSPYMLRTFSSSASRTNTAMTFTNLSPVNSICKTSDIQIPSSVSMSSAGIRQSRLTNTATLKECYSLHRFNMTNSRPAKTPRYLASAFITTTKGQSRRYTFISRNRWIPQSPCRLQSP